MELDLPNVLPSAIRRTDTLHSSPTSEVYAAMMDEAPVVVKRTKITSRSEIARFEKEVALLLACSHPNVVRPLAQMRAPPTYAFILPLFPHGALFGMLHNSGRKLSLRGQLAVLCDVASALAHLHEVGVLHRDVKSDNVLIDGRGRAVLVDFNAAEKTADITADIVAPSRPSGGFFKQFVVGTLPYMAPELLRSVRGAAYSDKCDVYSCGILLNEARATTTTPTTTTTTITSTSTGSAAACSIPPPPLSMPRLGRCSRRPSRTRTHRPSRSSCRPSSRCGHRTGSNPGQV